MDNCFTSRHDQSRQTTEKGHSVVYTAVPVYRRGQHFTVDSVSPISIVLHFKTNIYCDTEGAV